MMESCFDNEMLLRRRIEEARARIGDAARRTGRAPGDVLLIAATKTQSAESVRMVLRAGADAAGENRVQEMLGKWDQGAYEGRPLHFIGRLQRNKARFVVGRAALIHSVDSAALAEEIDRLAGAAGLRQDVLLQVNIAREETKAGFLPEELPRVMEKILALQSLSVKGLMVIPPPARPSQQRDTGAGRSPKEYFMETQQLLIDIWSIFMHTGRGGILSMGMSGDFVEAVEAGAHMVRLGEALFGRRPPARIEG